MVAVQTDNYGIDEGYAGIGVIRIESNVADTETVTIGSDVYEFDRAENGVTSGRNAVTGHSDDTPANATDALITAINANDTNGIRAIDIDANEILLVSKGSGSSAVTLAETMGGANNSVQSLNEGGGTSRVMAASRVPSAQEVAIGQMHFACVNFDPTVAIVQVRTTASGALKSFDGDVIITVTSGDDPAYITVKNDGATDFSATDTVCVIAAE